MGTSSRLATILDLEMLRRKGVLVHPPGTTLSQMQQQQPSLRVHEQLAGRYLVRYVLSGQIQRLLRGTSERQFVTPTPYAPEETIAWLALPAPTQPRTHAILLDPTRLYDVYGPRIVQLGGGIEYVLDRGFLEDAIVDVSPDPSGAPSKWAIEVR